MLKFRTMPVTAEAASGPGLVAARRAARHALRHIPAAHEPRRAAAAHQRPARRDVAGRPATRAAGVRRAIPLADPGLHAKAPREGGHHAAGRRSTTCAGDSDLGQRIQYDLYYIDNWSLWFDLRILVLHALAYPDEPQRGLTLPALRDAAHGARAVRGGVASCCSPSTSFRRASRRVVPSRRREVAHRTSTSRCPRGPAACSRGRTRATR